MATKKKDSELSGKSILPIFKKKASAIALLAFSIFILLSLSSFSIDDYNIINEGVSNENWLPANTFGILGAYTSIFLFQAFGGGAYFLGALLLICALRHLFFKTHAYSMEYFFGIGLMTTGASMIMGIWPASIANPVVIARIPDLAGGVVGQRFCAPGPEYIGWLYQIANQSGCLLISGAILLLGFIIIWLNDWNSAFIAGIKLAYKSITADRPEKEKKPSKAKKVKVPKQKKQKPQKEETGSGFFSALKGKTKTVLETGSEAASAPKQPELNVFDTKAEAVSPAQQATAIPDMPTYSSNSSRKVTKPSKGGVYSLPPMNLLSATGSQNTGANPKEVEHKKRILQQTLESFRIDAQVSDVTAGPRVTLFEIVTAPGVNLKKITSLNANIAMDLKAHSLRILAPIPGKSSVGIEVPNEKAIPVGLRSLLESGKWQRGGGQIPLVLGRDISGDPICLDLAKAPHLLIAGATGSGKSVCMNTIIASMLYRFSPEELQLILVDPKVVEFKNYETLPHLVTPVVNDPKKVTMALHWAVKEMERRYKILAQCGVKNLEAFNNRPKSANLQLDEDGQPIPAKMPFLVIIIDELADIMMTAKGDVETCLARIAQLGRASGIHAIVATQRPSVNVITGIIKANFPTRIAFKVTSAVDSRTILDQKGADQLLGQGDMLFNPPGASQLQRIQGAYVPENELESVVEYVAAQAEPQFNESIFLGAEDGPDSGGDMDMTPSPGFADSDLSAADEELLKQAVEIIIKDGRATTSYIQRSLRIGYNRAATIIDELEKRGIIGPQIGSAPREILINTQQ